MTEQELLLLKQWIISEDIRLSEDVRFTSSTLAAEPSELSAIRCAQQPT